MALMNRFVRRMATTARPAAVGLRCMATERVGPSIASITETQRKNLGCPDYDENMIKTWQDSPITIDGEYLKIQGHPVMEEWERPYMARLAEIATSNGGRVLELGFGMAISATYVQSHPIEEHD